MHRFSSSQNTWLDYLVVALLVSMSGNMALMGATRFEYCLILTSLVLGVILVARREFIPTSRFMVVVSGLCGILTVQCLTFDFWPFHTMIGFLLRVFIGYGALRLVTRFPKKYVDVLFYSCLISWPFHLFTIMYWTAGVDVIKYFGPLARITNPSEEVVYPLSAFHIFVHNFFSYPSLPESMVEGSVQGRLAPFRNSSYFWEPGAFAGYILLAIVFLGITKGELDNRRYRNALAVLIITLLTTMSTTGYVLLPLCLVFHLRAVQPTAKQVPQLLWFTLIVALLCVALYRLDFVGEKIREQNYRLAYREAGWELTRLGSLVYDLEYIKERPFFGWGPHGKTRHAFSSGVGVWGMGNGLSDFVAKFGLLGLATVLTCIWIGTYQLTRHNWKRSTLFVIFVVMLLNGEQFADYPLFWGLVFLESASQARLGMWRAIRPATPVYKRTPVNTASEI